MKIRAGSTLRSQVYRIGKHIPEPVKVGLWNLSDNPRIASHPLARWVHSQVVCWRAWRCTGRPPQTLLLETINRCNARCGMCPQPNVGRPAQYMHDDLFNRVIADCVHSGVGTLQLNGTNEPLLDPQIISRIRYAKKAGVRHVQLFTNGMLLTQQLADGLMQSGIDLIIASVDGFDRQSYERTRVGLSFETVVGNLFHLLEKRRALGLVKPYIVISNLRARTGDQEPLQLTDVARRLMRLADAVDLGHVRDVHDWAGQVTPTKEYRDHRSRFPRRACRRLWSSMSAHADGSVVLCCLDFAGHMRLGNLGNRGLLDIWTSVEYESIRRLHLQGHQGQIELCRNCRESDTISWIARDPESILKRFERL